MKLRTKTKIWFSENGLLKPLSQICYGTIKYSFYKEGGKIILEKE